MYVRVATQYGLTYFYIMRIIIYVLSYVLFLFRVMLSEQFVW